MYKMFIDDERDPIGDGWVVLRSYDEVVDYLRGFDVCPSYVSFDHDLGEGKTGYDVALLFIDEDARSMGKWMPKDFQFFCHTQNPVGKHNIEQALNRYLELRLEFWN